MGDVVEVLSTSAPLPFPIDDRVSVGDEVRLKYRYLDLRRQSAGAALRMRSRVNQIARDVLLERDFVEIETPTLTRSTPEGARDFLVPVRLQPGHWYALPQSPQLFKQLLMVAGMERYFQIARCYRDEDFRADRQPEFTQLDIEMSFVEQDDVIEVGEAVIRGLWKGILGYEIGDIPRMTYHEAMRRFGSDKPDLRFGLELVDLTEYFAATPFRVFQADYVGAVVMTGGADQPRRAFDAWQEWAKQRGAKGLAYVTVDADGTPRLEIVFGRAIVRASRRDAHLGMNAGQIIGTVIDGLIEPIAIHVELERSAGANPAVDPTRVHAGIISVEGGFVWRQGAGQLPVDGGGLLEGMAVQGLVESRNSISWDSLRPTRVTVARQRELPEWTKSATRSDPLEKSACERLAARAVASLPLDQDLREIAAEKSGRVEDKQLAVSTLALLGEFNELVEVLCASAPGRKLEARQWTTLEATTVPLALSRGTIAADKLRAAFETHSPHGKAEWLWAMARGFTDDDLTNGAAAGLVKSLDDGELVVRRYAFKCLTDIARSSETDKLRYRPDWVLESRREGVQWWKGQLEKGAIRHAAESGGATGP